MCFAGGNALILWEYLVFLRCNKDAEKVRHAQVEYYRFCSIWLNQALRVGTLR